MWLYLETGPLERFLRSNEVRRVGPNPVWQVSPVRTGGHSRHVLPEKRRGEGLQAGREASALSPTCTLIVAFQLPELLGDKFLSFKPCNL